MEIKYTAWYKTVDGKSILPIHGFLSDEDIQEAIKNKEDRTSIQHTEVKFESADYDSIIP